METRVYPKLAAKAAAGQGWTWPTPSAIGEAQTETLGCPKAPTTPHHLNLSPLQAQLHLSASPGHCCPLGQCPGRTQVTPQGPFCHQPLHHGILWSCEETNRPEARADLSPGSSSDSSAGQGLMALLSWDQLWVRQVLSTLLNYREQNNWFIFFLF